MTSARPLIGLSSCIALHDGGAYHEVKNQYHDAILSCTSGLAVSIPAMAEQMDLQAYVDRLDGLVLTGSLSNVHPSRYQTEPTPKAEPYDQRRDALTFQLLDLALKAGLPTLCICRGFQEANVFFGGTLYPCVHDADGFDDHRHPEGAQTLAEKFALKHPVEVLDGHWAQWLEDAGLLPADRQVMVNSLHLQGVKTLGAGLRVEARAGDGLVEAFSAPEVPGFFWAGQFHPEWDAAQTPQYRVIFAAFDRAAVARHQVRDGGAA